MAVLAIRDATGRISFYSIYNNKQIHNILEPFNQERDNNVFRELTKCPI